MQDKSCIGKAHYLGVEYENSIDGKDIWPTKVTMENEGTIEDKTWCTMEYIREDIVEGLLEDYYQSGYDDGYIVGGEG